MNWQDLLYFSKGERRALSLLLCLICISWISLLWIDEKPQLMASDMDGSRRENALPSNSDSTTMKQISSGSPSEIPPKTSIRQKKSHTFTEQAIAPVGHSSLPKKEVWKSNKFPVGTVVELNTADSLTLQKIPGIGPAFARRIVKYRELLGGFYSVAQLAEVYGIDEERYAALLPWFRVDTTLIRKLEINQITASSLRKHPYINYIQARTMEQLRKQKSRLSGWENLQLLEEFTDSDRQRLLPYLSFQ